MDVLRNLIAVTRIHAHNHGIGGLDARAFAKKPKRSPAESELPLEYDWEPAEEGLTAYAGRIEAKDPEIWALKLRWIITGNVTDVTVTGAGRREFPELIRTLQVLW